MKNAKGARGARISPAAGKLPKRAGRRQPRQNPEKLTDAFTLLCRSELGVECVKELQFHPRRRWRFDYAVPAVKVALEVEGGVWTGGRHTRGGGFLGDMEKYNAATLMGWRVLRTTPDDLYSSRTLNMLSFAISGTFYTKCTENGPKDVKI